MKTIFAALCLVMFTGCAVDSPESMQQSEEGQVAQSEAAIGGACTLTCTFSTGWVSAGCPAGEYCSQGEGTKFCYIGDVAEDTPVENTSVPDTFANDNVPFGTVINGTCVGRTKLDIEEN